MYYAGYLPSSLPTCLTNYLTDSSDSYDSSESNEMMKRKAKAISAKLFELIWKSSGRIQ